MDTFFPSEIARLVLGYLKEDKCLKSWQTFLEESSNLREYLTLFKKGKVYSTNVNGSSLLDILNEYSVLKFQATSNNPKTECFSSKSDIIKTLKEDGFIESTKQTVDSVFQKYISPSDNSRDNVSTDSSLDVYELPNNNTCSSNEVKKPCTDVTENLSIIKSYHRCDEQIAIYAKNNVNNRNKSYEPNKTQEFERNKKLSTELDAVKERNNNKPERFQQRKVISNSDSSSQSLTSFIQSLSDKLNKKRNRTVNLPNVVQHRHDLKDNSQSISKLKSSDKENAVSSTETVPLDDDDHDVEIVEEIIKEKRCYDNLSSKDRGSCSTNTSANQKAIDNIAEENTPINEPKKEIDSANNSNVEVLQTNSFKDIRTEKTDANDQNKLNVPESKTDYFNNQVSFLDSGTFIQPSVAVNEMPFSFPQNYIYPNYAPSNSFNNNAPVYVVLNTPAVPSGPIINGTILTVPTVQTNTIQCPVLPAVSKSFVNNSITDPVNNFSSPLPTTNTATKFEDIQLPSMKPPPNAISIAPPIGQPNTLKKESVSKTKVDDKVLKSSVKTYSKESQLALELFSEVSVGCNKDESSKVSKRKKSPQKRGQKKKMKDSLLPKDQLIPTPEAGILSLIDYKGEHSNKSRSKISSDNCPLKVQKATKRKRSKEKKNKNCKKKKTSYKSPSPLKVKIVKPKTSWFQSVLNEQHFPQHLEMGHHLNTSSNIVTKTNTGVNDSRKLVSTFSTSENNFNNSTLIKSSLPCVEENRVLKVVLSDIFVDIHHKIDKLHDQGSYSSTELSMQGKSENQISDPEKNNSPKPKICTAII